MKRTRLSENCCSEPQHKASPKAATLLASLSHIKANGRNEEVPLGTGKSSLFSKQKRMPLGVRGGILAYY